MKKSDRGPQVIQSHGSSVPIPVGRDTDLAQKGAECLETVALDMYDGDELEFLGKSRLEVAVLTLAQDSSRDVDARKEFLDRTMGKPKQRVDSTSVSLNLTEYLQMLADEEAAPAEVIDAEPSVPDVTETEDGLPFLC